MIRIHVDEVLGCRALCLECPWRTGWLDEPEEAQELRERHRLECRNAVVWHEAGEVAVAG